MLAANRTPLPEASGARRHRAPRSVPQYAGSRSRHLRGRRPAARYRVHGAQADPRMFAAHAAQVGANAVEIGVKRRASYSAAPRASNRRRCCSRAAGYTLAGNQRGWRSQAGRSRSLISIFMAAAHGDLFSRWADAPYASVASAKPLCCEPTLSFEVALGQR
jgi:hypothetical protein